MCGGDLNITADEKIIECEYCGSTQTVPDGSDEKKTNLFNRANRLRMDNEFDKASGVYESIVSEFPEEAEGYWGLVLCSYGIEYVDDAKTGKKIPTCHRTLTSSVMDDDNFVQACENADVVARGIYREEAKAIDKLQQKIIAVVENEEPYDVFICYKETDDITKSRTEDSLIAQDIYTELIKEGYKVFFSRVTLRDKAGTEYEPYIYAALKSAKIMLAIGTKFDYYDAVWVKNEWSRYISMMADDSSKHLIPCFKNLDAYDIPKEFKNLQALDMGEVTFFKNLTDNVERFIPRKAKEHTVVENIVSSTGALTKRGYIYLEDKDFIKADEYFDKALDENPEDSKAYLGRFLATMQISSVEEVDNYLIKIDTFKDFERAVRFADAQEKVLLEEIRERSEKKYLLNCFIAGLKKHKANLEIYEKQLRNKKLIDEIDEYLSKGTIEDFKKGINLYESADKSIFNTEKKDLLTKQVSIFRLLSDGKAYTAGDILHFFAKYFGGSLTNTLKTIESALKTMVESGIVEKIDNVDMSYYALKGYAEKAIAIEKSSKYRQACDLMTAHDLDKYLMAINLFEEIVDWKDSADKIIECQKLVKELKEEMERRLKEKKAKEEQERLEREKQAEEEKVRKEQEEIRLKEQKERQAKYRQAGLCQHCGGEIKGLFVKTCVKCGKKKDY